LGFDFAPKDDRGLLDSHKSFHLFSQGHAKKISNILRGASGDLAVMIFDYTYTTGSGKSSSTWRQTAIGFRVTAPTLPAFSLRPESFFDRLGKLFGYQDINFEEHPIFSRSYLLRGPDEAAIRDAFTEDVLTYFEENRGLSTEANGDHLLYYRHNKRV